MSKRKPKAKPKKADRDELLLARDPGAPELGYIHESIRRLARPIAELVPHPRNARRHTPRNLDEIAASLKEHGQIRVAVITARPMVLAGRTKSPAGTVLVGNGMMQAGRERLGWTHLAAIAFDGSDEDARKLALRDNRTGELAEWDLDALRLEIGELGELGIADLGWSLEEVEDMTAAPVEDPSGEWSGMPEFDQRDNGAARRIVVNFKSQADAEAFGRLLEQPVTESTRSLWYPPVPIERYADKRYARAPEDEPGDPGPSEPPPADEGAP